MTAPDVEQFPIGYRFVDYDGDVRVVVGYGDGNYDYDTVYRTADGEWKHMPTDHDFIVSEFKPYVEPLPLPAFKHFGWVAPGHALARSGEIEYAGPDGDRWFEYGIEAGELFIRWTGDE